MHAASQDLPCLFEVGLLPTHPVRHRARRPAARLPPGRARHDDRADLRRPAAQGALGGRLVHPAAARRLAPLRRARRRAAGRAARRAGRRARRAGQAGLGASRSSPPSSPAPASPPAAGPTPGGARPASTASATRAGSASSRELWYARDAIAQRLDRAPGRILPDARHQRGRRVGHAPAATPCGASRPSPGARPSASSRLAGRHRRGRAAAATPSSRPCTWPPTARRRPGVWAVARTPRPPPGWPRSARRSRPGPPSSTSRWRTCSPPSTSAAWPGRRRQPVTEESVDAALAACGARPWQRELTVRADRPPLLLPPEPRGRLSDRARPGGRRRVSYRRVICGHAARAPVTSSSSTASAPPSARRARMYAETRADDLVVNCIRELMRRHPELPPERIDEVAIAATTQTGDQGLTIGRTPRCWPGSPAVVPGLRDRPDVRRRHDGRHHRRLGHRLRRLRRRDRRRRRAHGPPPDGSRASTRTRGSWPRSSSTSPPW